MTKQSRSVRYFVDADGQRCAAVQLANPDFEAILYVEDLLKVQALGVSLNWWINSNGQGTSYVKVAVGAEDSRVVARIIAEAEAGQQVRYRNRNRLDLRGDNLRVSGGGNAFKDCSHLTLAQQAQTAAPGEAA